METNGKRKPDEMGASGSYSKKRRYNGRFDGMTSCLFLEWNFGKKSLKMHYFVTTNVKTMSKFSLVT